MLHLQGSYVNMLKWLSTLNIGVHPIRIIKGDNLVLVYIHTYIQTTPIVTINPNFLHILEV